MNAIKKILSYIGWTIVICLAVVCGTITFKTLDPFKDNTNIPSSLRNFETTDFFGFQPYTILSDSMKPEFEAGDVILTWLVGDEDEVVVGDVYTYTLGDPEDRNIVVHRLTEENEDGTYTFQGDNNNTSDLNSVSRSQLQAKYFARIPKLGYVINFINQYIYIVIGLIVVYVIYVLFFEDKLNEDDDEAEDDDVIDAEVSEVEKADNYAFDKEVEVEEELPEEDRKELEEINTTEATPEEVKEVEKPLPDEFDLTYHEFDDKPKNSPVKEEIKDLEE